MCQVNFPVPLNAERQAALRAIAETERRLRRGARVCAYPYAAAFFRHLNGSRRITLADLRAFSPALTADALHGRRERWLRAVDLLIESQGDVCCLPLPSDAAEWLFPAVGFRAGERRRQKLSLSEQKYTRQRCREEALRQRAYQACAGQAEIDLAFHTPETVGSWLSRWSGGSVPEYELESMLMRWRRRFPSVSEVDLWPGEPLWRVGYELTLAGKSAAGHVRALERWMVPNKLTHKEAAV
ncbi:psiA family protein [Erwinia sp. OLTSP20]|uniref:plasmid SOS inhibition protein A n=1 Tax=unclassified Erwinia TaxID=2622719 RepID=UPI000C1861B7|nr:MULTISPECIES: plasmid SOS inhibition protein A [unclassified Erwinia]PIJ50013.1 psiA family protein [Erwinia sp. OAMSP11]PIJ72440.1 psiA family protein [Erwinia sp. OLSSP12]PIJ80063.1 psiA family protein [Erwinia sp. OLCASP19]PIJ82139.1 psiA family protein [Erwinia sp. OLMTSP26]PIJ86375.1 psiA family protein [Erwinia sp. OLMDSP33]